MEQSHLFDLVVAGGGTAGALSAIAAARRGLSVAVIDRGTCLGGTATTSGLTEINSAGFQRKPVYHGLQKELFDDMVKAGDAEYYYDVPMSSNPEVKLDRLRYNPEMLKLLLEEKAVCAKVRLYYGMELVFAEERAEQCKIVTHNRYGELELRSRYLIDGTGNAELVSKLGGVTRKTEPGKQMVNTLMFRLSGVDKQLLQEFISSQKLYPLIEEGCAAGILKGKLMAFTPIPGSGDVSLNVTRAKCDYEDPKAVSDALVDARAQIRPILQFIRERVPGMQHAAIANIAAELGVRDSRTIRGRYTLTVDDLMQMKQFEDGIAVGSYPVDIHDPVTDTVVWKLLPGIYHIPYRSLLPQGLHRTMVAGKCLDAERQAFAAVRVMSGVMNIGESAGYAAALAAQKNVALDALAPKDLTGYLEACFCHSL